MRKRTYDPNRVYNLLAEIFGPPYSHSKMQFKLICFNPGCGDSTGNLEINLEKGIFHCWRCNYSGNLEELLKDYLGYVPPIEDQFYTFEQIKNFQSDYDPKFRENEKFINLPEEFCPLWQDKKLSMIGQKALEYALKRMSMEDIKKYNIGYCGLGEYRWRLIIPFIENGKTVYFAARTIFPNFEPRYYNPTKEKYGVGSDEVVFNIDGARIAGQAIINEGVFDAIRAGDDAVALLKNNISDIQFYKLSEVEKIYIMLDSLKKDPTIVKKALKIAERFQSHGKHVYLIFPPDKDPAEWPREEIRSWIFNAKPFSRGDKFFLLKSIN